MEFNKCEICGANGGRAGMLIKTEECPKYACLNCHETWKTGALTIFSNLSRTAEELEKTTKILDCGKKPEEK
jgi:hypothetical protein